MNPLVETGLALAKEIFGLFRDFNDPAKREANYRLYLEKRAQSALKEAELYIDQAEKFVAKVQVLAEIPKDKVKPDDINELKEARKWMVHHRKRFKVFK